MPLPAINLIVIRANDVDQAVTFYEGLGIAFRPEKHGCGPNHFSGDVNGVVVEIYPASNGGSVERGGMADLRLGFQVPNIERALVDLVARGGVLLSPAVNADGQCTAVVADPDGHRVELSEVIP